MSTTPPLEPPPQGPVEETNAAIRRLMDAQTTDTTWPSEEYGLLLVEWAEAMAEPSEPVA
ncbi:hypothetical protein [Streptomyces sp. NPDC051561]|uniref:hypothetical protein n=1 Tax=Streptomyces sp. NPDC051561 TaxID=3365658 RepID=UPI00379D280F